MTKMAVEKLKYEVHDGKGKEYKVRKILWKFHYSKESGNVGQTKRNGGKENKVRFLL